MKNLVILQLLGCILFSVIIVLLWAAGVFSPLSVIIVYLFMGLCNIYNAWKMLMKPIHDISTHDELTGCHNRTLLESKIPEYEKHSDYAVIFFDVNNLKMVNDVHGHNAGDEVLVKAAEQLSFWHKYGDLYRVGGDEFIVVVTNMSDTKLSFIADDWYKDLPPLNEGDGDDFVCCLSFGICYHTASDRITFKDVMDNADEKMYEMKKRIKGV
ncbi:MAG: GGDEF domain-containing protein [Oscillospiraceae bacterium]|nr:GGDEF domain-containing protein [Oscillospiraceae bacterium]